MSEQGGPIGSAAEAVASEPPEPVVLGHLATYRLGPGFWSLDGAARRKRARTWCDALAATSDALQLYLVQGVQPTADVLAWSSVRLEDSGAPADFFRRRAVAESAYRDQQAVESKARTIVGVNAFAASGHEPVETLYIDEAAEREQRAGLERLRRERDGSRVRGALEALKGAAAGGENTMPRLLDAVRAYATVGEMCDALREVWGEYTEVPII